MSVPDGVVVVVVVDDDDDDALFFDPSKHETRLTVPHPLASVDDQD
jgi:hypothetical protein